MMKSVQKLVLRRETLRTLDSLEMTQVIGAGSSADPCPAVEHSVRTLCPVRANADELQVGPTAPR
jgi:hypothetical protein